MNSQREGEVRYKNNFKEREVSFKKTFLKGEEGRLQIITFNVKVGCVSRVGLRLNSDRIGEVMWL